MRSKYLSLAFVAVVLAGGCGNDDKKGGEPGSLDSGQSTTSTTGAVVDPTSPLSPANLPGTPNAPGGAAGGGGPGASGNPATPGSGGGDDEEPPPPQITVELASPCVKHGGTQTVTIRTDPNSAVGFDTTWSDGKNGMTGGYGGTANGSATNGTWAHTFTVGPQAPPGKATVTGIGVNQMGSTGQRKVDFTVVDIGGACP